MDPRLRTELYDRIHAARREEEEREAAAKEHEAAAAEEDSRSHEAEGDEEEEMKMEATAEKEGHRMLMKAIEQRSQLAQAQVLGGQIMQEQEYVKMQGAQKKSTGLEETNDASVNKKKEATSENAHLGFWILTSLSRTVNIPSSEPGAFPMGGTGTVPEDQAEQEDASNVDLDSDSDHQGDPVVLEAQLVPSPNSRTDPRDQLELGAEEPVIEAVKLSTESQRSGMLWPLMGVVFLLVVIVLLVIGLVGVFDKNEDEGPTLNNTTQNLTRMERIQQAGVVRCGYQEDIATSYFDENGTLQGFAPSMCRIIAAAASVEAEFVLMEVGQRFSEIVNDTYDVLIRAVSHTMERSIHEPITKKTLSFSVPYLYESMKLAGDPFYVRECADKNLKHTGECSGIRICLWSHETSQYKDIQRYIPERFLVAVSSEVIGNPIKGLINGTCNLVGNGGLPERMIRKIGYKGPYALSQNVFSKEPWAIVTDSSDPEWSDFVNAILQSLLVAEYYNITQADTFPQTLVFGDEHKDAFQKALAVEGHFGVLFAKYWENWIPRNTLNFINNGSTGLLYSHPLGDFSHDRGEAPLGTTLLRILDRGVLRCGIRSNRPGFANQMDIGSYAGMDVDYCRALAAALFESDEKAVVFTELVDQKDGFVQLANGNLDVVAGATLSLQNDVREATTGIGFAFSQPYFYGLSEEEDNLSLATKQDDNDWVQFVYWTVGATIYAEETNITQADSNRMPEILLFGQRLIRCFRDPILRLGNYADIYRRNVEPFIPRGGRNTLNMFPHLGPQHYVVPGYV